MPKRKHNAQNELLSGPYYFFLKSGAGNRLLEFAFELRGFWIGYHGQSNNLRNKGLANFYMNENGRVLLPKLENWVSPDYHLLCMASSQIWRNNVRICTYGAHQITIWQLTDALRPIAQKEANFIRRKLAKRNIPQGLDASHFLPAIPICEIPRSKLVAPIDSLSVFQYLNRGTFRPMFNLRSKVEIVELKKLGPKLKPIEIAYNQKENKTVNTKTLTESDYGKFVRLYLENMILKKCKDDTRPSTTSALANITIPRQRTKVIASILNPAQIETLAYLLVEDLGITADVALGKGLDVIDVKGTWRHHPQRDKIGKTILKELNGLGASISSELQSVIEKDFVLPIQCKARSDEWVEKGILGLKPIQDTMNEAIHIDSIGTIELIDYSQEHPQQYKKISDWIELLIFDLFR